MLCVCIELVTITILLLLLIHKVNKPNNWPSNIRKIDGLKLIRTDKFNAVLIANKNTAKPNDCFDLQCISQHF